MPTLLASCQSVLGQNPEPPSRSALTLNLLPMTERRVTTLFRPEGYSATLSVLYDLMFFIIVSYIFNLQDTSLKRQPDPTYSTFTPISTTPPQQNQENFLSSFPGGRGTFHYFNFPSSPSIPSFSPPLNPTSSIMDWVLYSVENYMIYCKEKTV